MNETLQADVRRAADILAAADALIIAAGAGIGVDSGLPDFRGNEGFWRAYPALAASGLAFTEVASPRTFERDPALAWGFYGHRLALYRATRPHAGFGILRIWGGRKAHGARVFTSNVDGQFAAAGFDASHIVECHGSIHHLQCTRPCSDRLWPAADFLPYVDLARCRLLGELPSCPRCGAIARPNILMFGDAAWLSQRSDAQEQAHRDWLAGLTACGASIALVEIGAGTAVPSVRAYGRSLVEGLAARLVRINPREAQVPDGNHVGLSMGACEAIEAIERAWPCG